MKGTIVVCLKEIVEKKFGKPTWTQTLAEAGVPDQVFLASADVPDAAVMKVLGALSKVTRTPAQGLMEAFGDHWATEYAPRMYSAYFRQHRTAMDFLLAMDGVHATVTKSIQNAHPPRFTYEKKGPKSFVMTYASQRGLSAMVPGLIRGVARHYGAQCTVKDLGGDRFEVTFA
jgi:hypothetical protein